MAMDKECFFLTVDAYHNAEYSAIPFYEKMGFFAIEEFSDDSDTLRMAKRLAWTQYHSQGCEVREKDVEFYGPYFRPSISSLRP